MDDIPLKIRPMAREDLPQVMAIEKVSFPTPFSENLFLTELNLSMAHLDVVTLDGKVVGYVDFWDIPGEVHLINIAVASDKRGIGVGRRLMTHLVDFATEKKAKEIHLDVRRSNEAAINLYKKFGFDVIGVRKGYYQSNGEDAFMMCRRLNG